MCVPQLFKNESLLKANLSTVEFRKVKDLLQDYKNLPPEETVANRMTSSFCSMSTSNLRELFAETVTDGRQKPKICSFLPYLATKRHLVKLCHDTFIEKVFTFKLI
jgi:hypothetical protein